MTTTPAMPEFIRVLVKVQGGDMHSTEAQFMGDDIGYLVAVPREWQSATLQAQPAAVSDEQIRHDANLPFVEDEQGAEWVTLSPAMFARAVRRVLALRPQAVTSEPGAYESRYAEWRQFYGNRITQWMSADELRLAVSRLMTVDAGSPELLLIHAMHLIDQAAPEWIAGEPANLQAAARDADEWLALIQRLNDAGRWRFSQPDSRAKLDGCRVALSKILCAHAPKAVPMTDEQKAAPKLIGWRTENFLWETDDVDKARNWEPNIGVLPIFEGDPNTKLGSHGITAQAKEVQQ